MLGIKSMELLVSTVSNPLVPAWVAHVLNSTVDKGKDGIKRCTMLMDCLSIFRELQRVKKMLILAL